MLPGDLTLHILEKTGRVKALHRNYFINFHVLYQFICIHNVTVPISEVCIISHWKFGIIMNDKLRWM
jgi:hypothetical protein